MTATGCAPWPDLTAGSAGVRNEELGELLGWFEPAQGLTGSVVERVGRGVEVVLAVEGEVGALGEVLAEQSVGVLVGASLPGAVGVAEVDVHVGVDAELGMFAPLFALLPGQSPSAVG